MKFMKNPWEKLDLDIYESHMKLATVSQLQLLNRIMKSQLYSYEVDSVGIWGIAGGNGLEHISCNNFDLVYGIDINEDYLKITKKRYSKLNCLVLKRLDLNEMAIDLDKVELIIANLLIEYVGLDTFILQIKKNLPKYLSCIIQKGNKTDFVSDSPYTNLLRNISELALAIDYNELISNMAEIGFEIIFREKYDVSCEKEFIRMDFENND